MRISSCIAGMALMGVCLSVPVARAAWGSIHGNNRSATVPMRPSFSAPRGGFERGATVGRPPAVRAPEVQPGGNVRGFEGGRGFAPAPSRNDWGRYRAWQGDRFRGDFDDDWGHSYYWTRFHPGFAVNVLPPDFFQFSIGGAPYYYYDGTYFQPQASGGYVVTTPPMGAVVPTLPDGAESVMQGDSMLYHANGTFYAPSANGYQVVAPPLGVTVTMLPPDATPVVINGVTYYQSGGVFYQPVMENGVTAYETVQPPQ